jgi:hypothetical protein
MTTTCVKFACSQPASFPGCNRQSGEFRQGHGVAAFIVRNAGLRRANARENQSFLKLTCFHVRLVSGEHKRSCGIVRFCAGKAGHFFPGWHFERRCGKYSMKFQRKNGRFATVDRVRRELSQEEFTCADCAEQTP